MTAELVREAKSGNDLVCTMRCYDEDGGTFVEADVLPVGATERVHRGPYRFNTAHEAFRFMQEALLAFEYLGCAVK